MFQVRILVGPPTFARLRCRRTRATVGRPNGARLHCCRARASVGKPNGGCPPWPQNGGGGPLRRDGKWQKADYQIGKENAVKRRPRSSGAFFVSPEAESLRSRPRDSEADPAAAGGPPRERRKPECLRP